MTQTDPDIPRRGAGSVHELFGIFSVALADRVPLDGVNAAGGIHMALPHAGVVVSSFAPRPDCIRDRYNGCDWLGDEKLHNPFDVLLPFRDCKFES